MPYKIKLLPCPFCGTQVTEKDILPQAPHPASQAKGWYLIRCWQCGGQVAEVTTHKRQIAAKWNRRTLPINDTTEWGGLDTNTLIGHMAAIDKKVFHFPSDCIPSLSFYSPHKYANGWYTFVVAQIPFIAYIAENGDPVDGLHYYVMTQYQVIKTDHAKEKR